MTSNLTQNLRIICKISLWGRWWSAWGTLPVWSWIFAARSFRDGDFRTAAANYERGLSKYPNHVAAESARFDYSYCLYRLGEHHKAADELAILTDKGSSIAESYLLRSEILMTIGRAAEAVFILQKARKRFPKHARIAVCLMFALIEAGESSEEILELRDGLLAHRAAASLDDPIVGHINTAIASFELNYGTPSIGERLLARVIASGSCSVEAVVIRASWLLRTGNFAQARRLAARAVEAAPRQPLAYSVLATSLLAIGSPSDKRWALQLAQTACKLSAWENAKYLEVLERAYRAVGEADAADLIAERGRAISFRQQLVVENIDNIETEVSRLQSLEFIPPREELM